MGDTILFCLKLRNTSGSKRTVNGTILLSSTYYTGVTFKDVKEQEIDKTLLDANEGMFKFLLKLLWSFKHFCSFFIILKSPTEKTTLQSVKKHGRQGTGQTILAYCSTDLSHVRWGILSLLISQVSVPGPRGSLVIIHWEITSSLKQFNPFLWKL